ncbi:hypothetical protein CAPTEDRAFT_209693 [Capitella teleta]|uniref:Uncharacterized protein n=1 Tax=Capitella teleta TaxID=283909 RepID=R7V288_CAPTE|nr:hypothetical protein CAPTEDRAFT_209693 [Capitella teleta]|eukprot:ELU10446.1 hypothetical protein CAPTEDRAFT_209693 [Capitella teleta]
MTSRISYYKRPHIQQNNIQFSLTIHIATSRSMVKYIGVLLALGLIGLCAASSSSYQPQKPSYPQPQRGYPPQTGYQQQSHGYEQKGYQKAKYCYQCAYSPPKTYYDKKVVLEKRQYGGYEKKQQYEPQGYGSSSGGHSQAGQSYHGGYAKKTYVPIPRTINGGWDKCLGPFDHYAAKDFGVDVWDCHSNCYVRKDPNGG